MDNLRIIEFNSTRKQGQMNRAKSFYPSDMTDDEITKTMQENKQRLVEPYGISYKDIFIYDQKNSSKPDAYEDGKSHTLTLDDIKNYDDLYDLSILTDIVKLTPETRNIAIAYPVADCAVVKAVNMKTNEITLAHCGGEYIDRYLPMQTIDALGGNEKDIVVYVSPFAWSLFYDDINNLKWANNPRVWDKYKEITEGEKTSVKVDVYNALKQQLLDRKIEEANIKFSPYDITKSDLFYSNSKKNQDPSYAGRNLSGIAIIDNDKEIEENETTRIVK